MERIAEIRSRIYDYFHGSAACQDYFFDSPQEERYAAYYTSMYLLQDTTESLLRHREKGFSADPLESYIEFWGIMQAIIIQQDSILELHEAITGSKSNSNLPTSWKELRLLRNTCAGHPAKRNLPKSKPLTRTFMGRSFGGYSSLTYEKWEKPDPDRITTSPLDNISHPKVNLAEIIETYEGEAASKMGKILKYMETKWPNT